MPLNMTSSINTGFYLSLMKLTSFMAKFLWDERRKAFLYCCTAGGMGL